MDLIMNRHLRKKREEMDQKVIKTLELLNAFFLKQKGKGKVNTFFLKKKRLLWLMTTIFLSA